MYFTDPMNANKVDIYSQTNEERKKTKRENHQRDCFSLSRKEYSIS